jgi:hypothetical protein
MKRATLLLEDGLFNQAKILGQQRGKTLKEVINDLLRFALAAFPAQKKVAKHVVIPLRDESRPRGGFDPSDRSTWDVVYDRSSR